MQFASVSLAKDPKGKTIVKLTTPSTRLVLSFDNGNEAQKWNDFFEMSIAISSSLEVREAPKTGRPSRSRRRHRNSNARG